MKLPFYNKDNKAVAKPTDIFKMPHTESNSIQLIAARLRASLQQVQPEQPIVVVCVGTDRSTGDCLGPLVGTYLQKSKLSQLHLYGTLDDPVHAMNLNDTISTIYQHYSNPFVIAIDACLGQLTSVGCIQIGDGPVKPGAGVNKELPPVGNMHITGIVNVGGFMEYFVLQNTRLSLVMSMADIIARSCYEALAGRTHWSTTSLAGID